VENLLGEEIKAPPNPHLICPAPPQEIATSVFFKTLKKILV